MHEPSKEACNTGSVISTLPKKAMLVRHAAIGMQAGKAASSVIIQHCSPSMVFLGDFSSLLSLGGVSGASTVHSGRSRRGPSSCSSMPVRPPLSAVLPSLDLPTAQQANNFSQPGSAGARHTTRPPTSHR